MHTCREESSWEYDYLSTVEKDKLRTLRSEYNRIIIELRGILANYLEAEPLTIGVFIVLERLERELEILDKKADQPLQQEDVRNLRNSLRSFISILKVQSSSNTKSYQDNITLSHQLLEKVQLLKDELNSSKEYLQSPQESNQSLSEDLQLLRYGYQSLETRNRTKEESVASLEDQLTSLKDGQRSIKENLTSSEDQLTSSQDHLTYSEDQLTSSVVQLTSSEVQLTSSEDQLTYLDDQLTSSEDQLTFSGDNPTSSEDSPSFLRNPSIKKLHIELPMKRARELNEDEEHINYDMRIKSDIYMQKALKSTRDF